MRLTISNDPLIQPNVPERKLRFVRRDFAQRKNQKITRREIRAKHVTF